MAMPDPDVPDKAPDFGMRRSTRRQLQNATTSLAARFNRLSRKMGKMPRAKRSGSASVDRATEGAANKVLSDMSRLSLSVQQLLKKLGVK
jgi:hypothetical protein